jgi:hypothetical protein
MCESVAGPMVAAEAMDAEQLDSLLKMVEGAK